MTFHALKTGNLELLLDKWPGSPRWAREAVYELLTRLSRNVPEGLRYIVLGSVDGVRTVKRFPPVYDTVKLGSRSLDVIIASRFIVLDRGVYVLQFYRFSIERWINEPYTAVYFEEGDSWVRIKGRVNTLEELYEAIVPKEVRVALAKGVKVPRQGDIWFLPIRRLPKVARPKRFSRAVLFNRHVVEADEIVVNMPSDTTNVTEIWYWSNAIYVLNPRVIHAQHGVLRLRGWYKVKWNKYPTVHYRLVALIRNDEFRVERQVIDVLGHID